MSYNGSGVYTLPGAALANGDIVSATENNQFRNDVAAALNVAWTRDGQAPATANIPMGTFKLTGLGAGTGNGDSVRYEQFASPPAIGSTTPAAGSFTTLSATGNVTLGDASTDTLNVGNGGIVKDSSGNVGIGTGSPDALLTVNTIASFGDGAVTTPSIAHKGDLNTGFWFPAADTVAASTGGTERMRIDSSGNVGIGTSSPSAVLDAQAASAVAKITSTTGTNGVTFRAVNTGGTSYFGRDSSAGGFGAAYSTVVWGNGAYPMLFGTNDTERMRIDSSGNLLVGTTSGNYKFVVTANYNAAKLGLLTAGLSGGEYPSVGSNVRYTSTTDSYTYDGSDFASMIRFNSGKVETLTAASGTAGNSISFTAGPYVAQGGTSWTNSSDERLKTDFEPIENAADKVNTLRSVIGRFKTDPQDKRRAFLIAQDVQAVLPEAVDASNPDNLGVQYTDVIPLLVAAIKELKAELDATKAEVAALKGA